MRVSIHPDAERELREAAEFYEREGSPLVAARFVREFRRLIELLGEHPHIGSPRARGRRGFSMSVFPYTLIYRATQDQIVILVVKHDSRRPGHGSKRS